MTAPFRTRAGAGAVPVAPVPSDGTEDWLAAEPPETRRWFEASGFRARPGEVSLVAGGDGGLARVLLGVGGDAPMWDYAALPKRLAAGTYRIDADLGPAAATAAATGWALGGYWFDRYKSEAPPKLPALAWPPGADRRRVAAVADATALARDLINAPAEDMGPTELAAAARGLAERLGARASVVAGDALLKRNYPLVHAVGRAGDDPPRLIDLRWGRPGDPKVTLVGKGVCFDTGGLDIKPAGGMLRMKKDMAGAAHALGVAHLVMALGTRVRLRVLIPAVENSISGNAVRPLDVIRSRKGVTVEIGNTDAEGRLILCDALAEACREKPALLADFATLTGAARVALGTDLPALFCNDDALADDLAAAGRDVGDPVWRLPLWRPYRRLLDSKVADICNVSEGGFAGAITAALYLQEFVDDATPWAHLDIMAWNAAARPGRPAGGEAQAMRAVFETIERRFGRGTAKEAARAGRPRGGTSPTS